MGWKPRSLDLHKLIRCLITSTVSNISFWMKRIRCHLWHNGSFGFKWSYSFSRLRQFHFDALSQQDFVLRILAILQSEGVKVDEAVLADHIDETYPDLRKCIGVIQKNTVGGVLRPKTSETFRNQSLGEVVNLFQQRKHTEARKMLISSLTHEEYPDAFRFLYENMSLFADTEEQEDDGLVIVRDGLFKHNFISDPEINISATIVQLVRMRS